MHRIFGGFLAAGLFAAVNAGASAQMMVPAMPNYTGQQTASGYYVQAPGTYPGGMVRMRTYASGYQGVMSAPPTTTVVTPGATVTVPSYRPLVQTRYYTMRPRMVRGRRGWGRMNPWRRRMRTGYAY